MLDMIAFFLLALLMVIVIVGLMFLVLLSKREMTLSLLGHTARPGPTPPAGAWFVLCV